MASWTDSVPEFKPYVQQLPVEAMVKVGMEKQKRYDEGVQKIQAQIDNVAGLDVYKDVDKQYLQSKLNALGNDLKLVAAGDFSNYQLVNSVSGMTSQIIKDEKIQNAVSSTKFIRNQLNTMNEERKKGTLHKNNEIFFNDVLTKYATSPNVGETFGTYYRPYTDYQKKWRDIKKELDIREDTSDLPFVMENGKIVIDEKTKKPLINDYMIKETFKGIDPQRLKEAIMSSMDDNDFQQIQIDSYVKYKGYTPEMMYNEAKERFNKSESGIIKTIDNLNTLKKNNVGNQKMVDSINKQLSIYTQALQSDREKFNETIKDLQNNPEAFKSKWFMMDALNQFSSAFSNMSHIQNVVDSPIRKQMNEDRSYNFEVLKFHTDNDQWAKDYDFKVKQEMNKQEKEEFDRKLELYKLGLGPNPLGAQAGKYMGAAPTDEEFLNGMMETFKQGADLKQLEKDQNSLKGQWAKNQPKGTDFEKEFSSALSQYNQDPNSIKDPSTRDILSKYSKLDKLYKLKANAIADANAEADESVADLKSAIETKLKDEEGYDKFSAYDVYYIDSKIKKFITPGTTVSSGMGYGFSSPPTFDDDAASRNLSSSEFELYKRYKDRYFGKNDPYISGFMDRARSLRSDYEDELKGVVDTRDRNFARILGNKINAVAPVAESLPAGSALKFVPIVEEKLAREQRGQTEEATGFVSGKDFNIDDTKALAADKETVVTKTSFGNDVYVTLDGKVEGKPKTQKFKISKDEFGILFPGMVQDDVDFDFLQSSAANGSTNYKFPLKVSAEMDPDEAFSSANYVNNNAKKYIVKGDIFFDQNNKNNTIPMIYVKSKKTGKVISIASDTFNTFTNSEAAISSINDLYIDNYLKNNNLDANF